MSTTALHASDCRCWLCIDRENRRGALAQQAPPSDHAEVWAQIEATLQGVIDDGTNAEIDELDAELLLGLVRSRGAQAPTGQQAERPAPTGQALHDALDALEQDCNDREKAHHTVMPVASWRAHLEQLRAALAADKS